MPKIQMSPKRGPAVCVVPYVIQLQPETEHNAVSTLSGGSLVPVLGSELVTRTDPMLLEAGTVISDDLGIVEWLASNNFGAKNRNLPRLLIWNTSVPFPEKRGAVGTIVPGDVYSNARILMRNVPVNCFVSAVRTGTASMLNRIIGDYQAGCLTGFEARFEYGTGMFWRLANFKTKPEPGFESWIDPESAPDAMKFANP